MTQGGARDIVELLVRRANRFGRWPAIRFHPDGGDEIELSWADWLEHARALANALRAHGVRSGHRVAIFARNCPEWLLADLGVLMCGAVCAPISRTAPAAARARMLVELQPQVVFVGTMKDLHRLRVNFAGIAANTQIVLFHPPAQELDVHEDWGAVGKPARFDDLLVRGRAILERGDGLRPEHSGVDPDAPATIVYSAGRSGPARGAVLTHRALLSKLMALREITVLPRSATQLLVLPLAGIFGRLMAWAAIDQGATTYLWNRTRGLQSELIAARPHFIAGAPSTFEQLREYILTRREGPVGMPGRTTLSLVNRFVGNSAKRPRKLLLGLDRAVARKAFRTRVRHLLGGRVQHLVCGGGMLDDSLAELFDFAGLPVLTGYGASETVAVATANRPDNFRLGSVGLPLSGVELRLSPDGEVLLRGAGMSAGYLRPQPGEGHASRRALHVEPIVDADGWYHTGDLGLIEDDFLFLTGRKEDIIRLSGGRTIAPGLIEGTLAASERVAFAVVCGEGRSHATALIWPAGQGDGEPAGDPEEEQRKSLQRLIDATNQGLERHELVRAFQVMPGRLSVETGELSASGEPIRSVIYRRYRDRIEALYSDG